MKKKNILILIILLIIGIIIWNIGFFNNNAIKSIFTGKIRENIYDVETEEAKSVSNDIYDVILFFGQSNMVGYCRQQPEKRYDPSNATSVANFSKLSGINTEILKNVGQYRNQVKITQEPGTAYIYKASTNSLEEITTSSSEQGNSIGEYLYKKKDSSGNLMLTITPPGKWDPAETWTEGKVAAETWAGVNMIPQFCQTYYKNTGHKVIAVFDAIGGVNLSAYVPEDNEYATQSKFHLYEPAVKQYADAIKLLNDNNFTIGNRSYVLFQGENIGTKSTSAENKADYKAQLQLIDQNLRNTLGIEKGVLIETAHKPGEFYKEVITNTVHQARKEVVEESNGKIIIGSTFAYDRYVGTEAEYNKGIGVKYNENGEKMSYADALAMCRTATDYYTSDEITESNLGSDNSIHFSSAALSQIGLETAESLSQVTGISILSQPTKKQYIQNYEKLDTTGGKLTVSYKELKNDVIDITSEMVSGFNNTQLGTQTLTITYGGKTVTYTVQINEKQISKIEMQTNPSKTEYIQNYEKLDVTGGKIKVTYNDTSTEEVVLTAEMISGFDNTKLGTQALTVTYGGKKATYTVQINEKQISKIEMQTNPTKVTYIQNYEKLDVTGGKIKVTYNDTSTKIVTLTAGMVTGFDNTKLGKQTLTVTYSGKTVTYTVQINAKQISKIGMEKLPTKLLYIQSYDQLDVTGGKIKVTYNDTSTEIVTLTEEMVSGFDNTKLGIQTLTVTYRGKQAAYPVQVRAKQATKIEIEVVPTKKTYIQNYEKLDVTGGKIKVTYDDTSTETVVLTAGMVSGFDNAKLGKQTLTVTYRGKQATYPVQIREKQVSKVEIEIVPKKVEYIQSYEELDVTGGKIKVTYDDTTTEVIDIAEEMVTGFDKSKLGTQILTVTYKGKTAIYEIQINAKQISKIEIEKIPTKIIYIQNYENLDVTGGKIKVTYDDTTTEVIDIAEEMVTGFDKSKLGTQILTVTYKGKTTTYTIEINKKPVSKIEIEVVPTKTIYIQNYEKLDVTGGKIKVTYDDTTTEVIDIAEEMVTGFDNTKLGTQTLTVIYKGKTTTYTIEINEKQVSKIEIEVFPTKTIYIQNYEKLDVTGGKIKATYDDTTTKVIDIAEEMVSGFDNTKVGKQTLTVTYGGKTATYEVQINVKQIIKIEIEKNPTKVEYIQNYEKLDVTGGKIKITYDDTSTEVILLTEEMVTGFDNTKLGKQILTVTYGKKMVTYEVRINEKQVDKIEIEKNPIKNVYIQNYEKLDVTGGKIKVTYNDATTETIEMTEKMVSGFDNKKLGRQTLTVTYEGKNTTYEIQISAKKIVKVEIQTKPTKVEYIQNYEKLDVTGGKIKVTYDDTTTETIDIAVGMVSGFDNTKVGKQTLTITYGEKVVTYEIEVKTKKISKIEIETKPTKTEYIQNYEKLDITGGKIKVVYNDTTTETVALTEEMVSGFDNTKVGKQKVNVKYRGMSTTLEVNIVAKKINKIEMETNPTKTKYEQNTEKLDVAGGKIKVEYNDTTTETIVLTEEMVKGFDNTKIGVQTLTVSYNEFNTSYKVTVVEKTIKKDEIDNQEGNKTEPKENNTIKNENKNQTQNETVNKNKLISVLPKTGKGKSIIVIMMILTITFSGYQILKLKKNRDIK